MKRILLLIYIICILAAFSGCNEEPRLGEVIGRIDATDVAVTLDGVAIPSVEIDGKAAIAIDDLSEYGFIVNRNDENKRIDVTTDYMPEGVEPPVIGSAAPGTKISDIISTDAVVYINGVRIDSYYTGKKTYVLIEELGALTDEVNETFGYSDYNFNYNYDPSANSISLNAFRFPGLDEDSLNEILAEREELLCNKEFDLYTEGDNSNAVYYGAKNEPESGVLAGIVSDGNGKPYADQPPIFGHSFGCYSNYVEFDNRQTDLTRPLIDDIDGYDCVLCIPWNTSDVTQVYDNEEYIRKTLDNISKYDKPTIVRFAAEMNVSSLGDSPAAYIKAFRFAADIIHRDYPNIAVMWSPNDAGALNRPMELYYPGDEYVDWIGVSSFLKRDFMGDPNSERSSGLYFYVGDFAWGQNPLRELIKFMEENNIQKPVAVSEGAVVSYMPYDESDYSAWAEPRLRSMYWYIPMRYPQIKLITYFNHTTPGEDNGYDIYNKPNYIDIIDEALLNGQYLLEYPAEPEFAFVKADGQSVSSDLIPLYSYVYLPEEEIKSVSYILDGVPLATLYDIPYKYELDVSALSEGKHSLTVNVLGEVSDDSYVYEIDKTGGSVKIGERRS